MTTPTAAITAQTNLLDLDLVAADYGDFEGDFFSFCDNMIDERNDLCY